MTVPPAPGPRWLGDAGQITLAAGLALVLLPVGWSSVADGEVALGWEVALLGALIALHAAVATARRRPRPSFVVGAVAELVMVAAPDLSGPTAAAAGSDYGPLLLPSGLCFFVLLYAVSAREPRPWPGVALGIGLVGCLLAVVRLWRFDGTGLEGWTWWLMVATATVAATVAAWALGRFQATRAAWTDQLADRAAADERQRIAREMHDVVAHSLAVVVSHAEAGRMVVAQQPERAGDILDTISTTGREALTEMRGLLGVLGGDRESPTTPQPGLSDLDDLVERMRGAGLQVSYAGAEPGPVAPALGLTAYRVVQEALTNVTRHAGAGAAATVTVTRTDRQLEVDVHDDGVAGQSLQSPSGRGLRGMRERVAAVGGSLEAGPDGDGWRVHAMMPL
ncbi:signal transduction histidine kinase [Nocardioides albertanoniae]|uniref:histidine kinase n=1 Tax=Nocardioides albertanoniae TaxID=1175486 RepID=A0A543ACV0_9ACTN|nr:histidine kinase [Nocardioides albertanoniae]TQL70370.1 signal transduction histidine kinase [Nocardioides albertanoniae]